MTAMVSTEEKLAELQAEIRRYESRSDRVLVALERMTAAAMARGDADLLQQVKIILGDLRAAKPVAAGNESRMH